jgi:PII interaction protein X
MQSETYLNHPNFGLLYRICILDSDQQLYATLYAQRMFFQVTTRNLMTQFEVVSRNEVRTLLDVRLRSYRRDGDSAGYSQLQTVYKTMF